MAENKKGILDNKGRFFGKLSVIDLLVVVLLVAVAGALAFRFTSSGMSRGNNCTVSYTVMIEGVRGFTVPNYEIGLECYDKQKKEYIGKITGVSSEPLEYYQPQLDGSLVLTSRPDDYRVFVTIEAEARETDNAYLINGVYELKVGSQINLNTKLTDVAATIYDKEVIK